MMLQQRMFKKMDDGSEFYPDVPFKREIASDETLLSIEKARSVLGYEPRLALRDRQEVVEAISTRNLTYRGSE
jgi:hypothetical protein